jgi:hypothetical protein
VSNYYYIQSKLKDGNGKHNVIDIQGNSGPLLDAYTKKTTDADNQLWEFIPDSAGSGYYFIKSKLNDNVIAVQQNSDTRAGRWDGTPLDVEPQQTGDNAYHQLWQFVEDPNGSGYCFIMSRVPGNVIDIQGASTNPGTQLDSWPLKPGSTDNQLWEVVSGSFPATVSTAQSGSSLGGNTNYFLYGNPDCTPLLGAGVVINITQDMVCQSVAPPTSANCPNQGTPYFGFSFQMNCYSPSGYNWAYQQYVVAFWRNSSGGFDVHYDVDNWPLNLQNPFNAGSPIMASLPSAVLPAGYQVIVTTTTTNSPAGGIGWATFELLDNNGNKVGGGNVTVPNPAPITAFELDIVGPVDSESATFSSGAGSISYVLPGGPLLRAFQPTTAQPHPPCTAGNGGTCETANTFYGSLPSNSSFIFNQSFAVDTTKPMIVRSGPMRPSTFVP